MTELVTAIVVAAVPGALALVTWMVQDSRRARAVQVESAKALAALSRSVSMLKDSKVDTMRPTILALLQQVQARGAITIAELVTAEKLGERYVEFGGNGEIERLLASIHHYPVITDAILDTPSVLVTES